MAKKKEKTIDKDVTVNDLASIIKNGINKKFKSKTVASFLSEKEEVTSWLSTGSSLLDLAISNRPHGGYPTGKIIELAGLEGCVTEDTKITVLIDSVQTPDDIQIKEVKDLLDGGHTVKVKTKNDEYTKIERYIEKGNFESFYVRLDNNYDIKVSHEHKFFTNAGWVMTSDLRKDKHEILCDDNKYHTITNIDNIGKQKIVDISVEHEDESYFGNGMLNHNSGKSLLATYALKHTIEQGGIGVFIDTESAHNKQFMNAIGVDPERLVIIEMNVLEDIYQTIEDILTDIKSSGKTDVPVTIVFDSQSAAIAKNEEDSDFEKQGWNTDKAIINSMAMRKITLLINDLNATLIITQQLRVKLGCVNPLTTNVIVNDNSEYGSKINMDDLFTALGYDYTKMEINKEYDVSDQNAQILTTEGRWNNIKHILRKEDSFKYKVISGDKTLETSNEHKILVKNKLTEKIEYKEVQSMFGNDEDYQVKRNEGWYDFTVVRTEEMIPIVDFELDGDHSYLGNDMVSHNTTFGDPYCVDPNTTEIQIRYKESWVDKRVTKFIYETVTLKDFSDRFANNDDLENAEIFEVQTDFDVQILSYDFNAKKDIYKPILTFVVKYPVKKYYTDGKLLGSSNHRIYNDEDFLVTLEQHPDFKVVNKPLNIVDIEVMDTHNYYANGRLNHNTTSGGKAIGFHASVRIRLKKAGQIKGKVNGVEQVIGIETLAQVQKNRVGPNMRKVLFKIYYDRGIADYDNWLDLLKTYNLVKAGGAWYTYFDVEKVQADGYSPIEYKFQKKHWESMLEENTTDEELSSKFIPGFKEQIYKHICDVSIMAYKSDKLDDSEISIDRNDNDISKTELEEAKLMNDEVIEEEN